LPIVLACALWYGLEGDRAPMAGFFVMIGQILVGIAVTTYFLNKKMKENPGKWTWREIWWELSFSNIFALKNMVEPTIQYIPDVWAYLVKGLIPHLLIILFVNAAATENDDGDALFGNYGGYPTKPFQIMGILTVVFAVFLFVVGFFYPAIYAPLATPIDESEQKKLENSEEGDSDDPKEVVEVVDDAKDVADDEPEAVEAVGAAQ
jgi:hypothetical protein